MHGGVSSTSPAVVHAGGFPFWAVARDMETAIAKVVIAIVFWRLTCHIMPNLEGIRFAGTR
jgi:hypothetical protein